MALRLEYWTTMLLGNSWKEAVAELSTKCFCSRCRYNQKQARSGCSFPKSCWPFWRFEYLCVEQCRCCANYTRDTITENNLHVHLLLTLVAWFGVHKQPSFPVQSTRSWWKDHQCDFTSRCCGNLTWLFMVVLNLQFIGITQTLARDRIQASLSMLMHRPLLRLNDVWHCSWSWEERRQRRRMGYANIR